MILIRKNPRKKTVGKKPNHLLDNAAKRFSEVPKNFKEFGIK